MLRLPAGMGCCGFMAITGRNSQSFCTWLAGQLNCYAVYDPESSGSYDGDLCFWVPVRVGIDQSDDRAVARARVTGSS